MAEVAALTTPARVRWCDGSDEEWERLTGELVDTGTLVQLNPDKKPNSLWACTDPSDVARVENRTFICSADQDDAGPTNNWMAPDEMKQLMTELCRGCMAGADHVHDPVLHGAAGLRRAQVRGGDHRLGVRCGQHENHDPEWARPCST